DPGGAGDRLGGEVVGGRAEAAGDEAHVDGGGQGGDDLGDPVTDRKRPDDLEPEPTTALPEEGEVGVDRVSRQQFVADGEDLGRGHAASPYHPLGSSDR